MGKVVGIDMKMARSRGEDVIEGIRRELANWLKERTKKKASRHD